MNQYSLAPLLEGATNSTLAQTLSGSLTVLYESDHGAMVVPHDFEAMLSLAKDTHWGDICHDGVTWTPDPEFQQFFEGCSARQPIVIYLLKDKKEPHSLQKFAYGFGSIMDFEDKETRTIDGTDLEAVHAFYHEAMQQASPQMKPYIAACAHYDDMAEYYHEQAKTVVLNTLMLGGEGGESHAVQLASIGASVIAGIQRQEYFACDMFGARVCDPGSPHSTSHSFGHPDLQRNIEFLLEADKVLPYSSRPLLYIDPKVMPEEEYSNIALMLIAQNNDNIGNVKPFLFENTEFVSRLLDIALIEQPASQQEILKHVHRIPALYGFVSGDFNEMKRHINLQTPALRLISKLG